MPLFAKSPDEFRVGQRVWQRSTIDERRGWSKGTLILATVTKLGKKKVQIEREDWHDLVWVYPREITDAEDDLERYG